MHGTRHLRHTDPDLALADHVALTLTLQKNDRKEDTVVMPRSGGAILCPVRAWAAITTRVLAYPTATLNTPVNAILLDGRLHYATAPAMLQHLRRGAAHFGPQLLGYAPDELGTHSIRAGAAMTMYLAGVPVCEIGRASCRERV
jgi:hypothetical protein